MTQHNARLLNEPRLRAVVEMTDDVSDACQVIADALSDYETAGELTGQDRTDGREDARADFLQGVADLLSAWDELSKRLEVVGL